VESGDSSAAPMTRATISVKAGRGRRSIRNTPRSHRRFHTSRESARTLGGLVCQISRMLSSVSGSKPASNLGASGILKRMFSLLQSSHDAPTTTLLTNLQFSLPDTPKCRYAMTQSSSLGPLLLRSSIAEPFSTRLSLRFQLRHYCKMTEHRCG
jgi:hypothetical protein